MWLDLELKKEEASYEGHSRSCPVAHTHNKDGRFILICLYLTSYENLGFPRMGVLL